MHGEVRKIEVVNKQAGQLTEIERKRFVVRVFLRKYKGKSPFLNSVKSKLKLTDSQIEIIYEGMQNEGRNFGRELPVPQGTSMSDRYPG